MPHAPEYPRALGSVVMLVRRERFSCFRRCVIQKFIAFRYGHSLRSCRRLARFCAGLEPGLAAIIGALDDLSKPAARLRGVDSIWIRWRCFHMIDFPTGKVRSTDIPLRTLPIRCQDESAFPRAHQNSYTAHDDFSF